MADNINITKRLLALSNETGYQILQRNGQRRYGPPPIWEGPPPKGTEIFIGKIPRDCYEDELVPVFSSVGLIYDLRLMMDFSGSNRGYCFVSYSTQSEAYKAVRELNGFEIRPKKYLGVVKSVDNCRLFVGGIPKTKSRENVYEELSKHVDCIVDVILYNSSSDKSLNRGFAFVEFDNHRAAAMARRALIPGRIQLWDNDLMVDWAEPEPDVDEEVMKEVKILYIRNLNPDTKLTTLQALFEHAINYRVERIKKIKDFAFVHFYRRDQAEMALDKLNSTMLDGCLIEVKWAKPVSNEFRLNKIRLAKYGCTGEVLDYDLGEKIGQLTIGTSDTDLSSGFIEDGRGSSVERDGRFGVSGFGVPAARDVPAPLFVPRPQLPVLQPCAIGRLDAICHKYNWSKPEYFYWRCPDSFNWLASVVLSSVGAPLFKVERSMGPSYSHSAPSSYLACVDAAQQVLFTMRKFCDQEKITPQAAAQTAKNLTSLPYQMGVQTPSLYTASLNPFTSTPNPYCSTPIPYHSSPNPYSGPSSFLSNSPGLFTQGANLFPPALPAWPPKCN